MKNIVFENQDGSLTVLVPAPNMVRPDGPYQTVEVEQEDGTKVEVEVIPAGLTLAEIAKKDGPKGGAPHFVEPEKMPSDRIFRGAWTLNTDTVIEDMEKSRAIAHEIRRSVRDKEMEPHDRLATVAGSVGEQAETKRAQIRARNAKHQTEIDDCFTVGGLKVTLREMGVGV